MSAKYSMHAVSSNELCLIPIFNCLSIMFPLLTAPGNNWLFSLAAILEFDLSQLADDGCFRCSSRAQSISAYYVGFNLLHYCLLPLLLLLLLFNTILVNLILGIFLANRRLPTELESRPGVIGIRSHLNSCELRFVYIFFDVAVLFDCYIISTCIVADCFVDPMAALRYCTRVTKLQFRIVINF